MRTVVLRVAALALLLLLALVSVLSIRTLRRLPDTIVYFVASEAEHFRLERVGRVSRATDDASRAQAALDALIAGPSEEEKAGGLFSNVPPETQVLGIELEGSTLSADFSQDLTQGGGSADLVGRLNQILYTLSQPGSVEAVSVLIEGRPVSVFGSAGVLVPQPFERVSDELPIW